MLADGTTSKSRWEGAGDASGGRWSRDPAGPRDGGTADGFDWKRSTGDAGRAGATRGGACGMAAATCRCACCRCLCCSSVARSPPLSSSSRLAASAAAWSVACAALATPEGGSRGAVAPLPPPTTFGPSPFGPRTDCTFAEAEATACSCKSSLAYRRRRRRQPRRLRALASPLLLRQRVPHIRELVLDRLPLAPLPRHPVSRLVRGGHRRRRRGSASSSACITDGLSP